MSIIINMNGLFVSNEIIMSIIIINPGSRYKKLNVEYPFSYALNSRNVELNSCPEPKKNKSSS